jgi:HlyD family secretion protein
MMKTGYQRALQIFAIVAIACLVAMVGYRIATRPAAVRVDAVMPGTVQEEITGPGTVQSRYSVSIGSRVGGTIERVLVDVGDTVKKDQLLATLDRTELDARYRATRGAVASAEQDVALASANLAKARSDLDLARIRDERARNLIGSGVISTAEADDARGVFQASEAGEHAARAAVDARESDLARFRQEQRVAETILSYTTLKSPMAGVISRRALEPGSAVATGAVVFQVVDANSLWIATLIDQSLAGRVKLGQRAEIHLRSGVEMSGRVSRIAYEADPVTRELEIDVAFDERPARFAIHEEADVTILGDQAQGLTVPLDAVKFDTNGSSVFVASNGRARSRSVRLGIVGAKKAQVITGLKAGESVVLAPNAVREGQRIAPVRGDK